MLDSPGYDAAAAILAEAKPAQAPRVVNWLTPAECAALPSRGYIIKGLIAPGDLALIFGGPGLGKSCIAPRLAYAIAQGEPVFGRRVRPGRVLYIAAEDGHGMRARVAALMLEMGNAPDLLLAAGLAGFMEPDGAAELALAAKVAEVKPAVVFLDTVAAAFSGLRENEAGADGMGRVVDFARGLIRTASNDNGPLAVVLIHHVPKGDASTPRGHGLLHGDADVALALSRDDAGLIRANFTKNRNGPSDGVLAFTIRAVTLGIDDDGDPITAPICEPADDAGPVGPRTSPQARLALTCLWDLLAAEGAPLPARDGFPSAPLKGVQEARWRAECDARRLSTAEDAEARSRVFRRIYQTLRTRGQIAARDGWVWPIPRGSEP